MADEDDDWTDSDDEPDDDERDDDWSDASDEWDGQEEFDYDEWSQLYDDAFFDSAEYEEFDGGVDYKG